MSTTDGIPATVIIPDSERAAAIETYPFYFQVGLSADGKAPATHWITSGFIDDEEINAMLPNIVNGWAIKVGRDSMASLLADKGLQKVEVVDATN